jgi:3'-phosphoadenosine 5'-phosphosulfate (PAPS) 3'-phosphatase
MVSALEFEKQFIKIIDRCIIGQSNSFIKDDFSLVTDSDILAESELIKFIKENFPNISIVSEENPSTHLETYELNNRFAIIDPIDGTENYYYTKSNYGSVVSLVYDDFVYHGIYIPSLKQIISSININNFRFNDSSIKLLSTSCLGFELKKIKGSFQNYRILGSSSYMFFLLLRGEAYSYDYCGRAKIWDYYTGISLVLMIKKSFDVTLDDIDLNKVDLTKLKLKHKSPFKIQKN